MERKDEGKTKKDGKMSEWKGEPKLTERLNERMGE